MAFTEHTQRDTRRRRVDVRTVAGRVGVGDGLKGLVEPVSANLRQREDHLDGGPAGRRAGKAPALCAT